jgi:hypothetical protein
MRIVFLFLFVSFFLTSKAQKNFDVLHYHFNLELSNKWDTIKGKAVIRIKATEPVSSFELDFASEKNGKGMTVEGVTQPSGKLNFISNNDKLTINFPITLKKGEEREVTIVYSGIPSDGLIIAKNKYGDRTFFSDNWPNRAHFWIPCYDLPNDKAGFLLPASVSLICLSALLAGGFIPRTADGTSMGPRIRGLRSIHVIALAAALASAAVIGMRSFLVVFAVAEGFQEGAAGALMAVMGLVAIASRLGFGLLGDRRPGDALRRAAMLMALTTAGFALMVIGGDALIVAGALIAGGIGWGWQSPLSLAVVSRHPTTTGAAIGIQMSGFFVGALIGPLVIGLLAEHGSYTTAWVMCACLAAAAGTVALIVRRLPHDSPLPPLAAGDGM